MNLQQALALVSLGIAGLKAIPQIDPTVLGYIQTADNAINAAVEAVGKAKTVVDPAQLNPITPV